MNIPRCESKDCLGPPFKNLKYCLWHHYFEKPIKFTKDKGSKNQTVTDCNQLEITDPGLKDLLKLKNKLVDLTEGKEGEE